MNLKTNTFYKLKYFILKTNIYDIFNIILIVFCFIYGISDLLTSAQTYNNVGGIYVDRKFCNIFLILMDLFLLGSSLFMFFKIRKELNFANNKLLIFFVILFFLLILFCPFSFLFGITEKDELISGSAYMLTSFLFFLYGFLISNIDNNFYKNLKLFVTIMFLFYFFSNLFYFVYIQTKPMTAGRYRMPALSHLFFLLGLIPAITYFYKDKNFTLFTFYTLFLLLCLISQKTSILIIFLIYLGIYLYFFTKQNKFSLMLKIFVPIFFIVLICIANFTKDNFIAKYLSFSSLFNSSGRIETWKIIFSELINRSTAFQIMFGRGYHGTMKITKLHSAHNDWLEYLTDYGIIGFLLFAIFIFYLCFLLIKNMRNSEIRKSTMFCLIYIFVMSLISSMFLSMNNFFYLSLGIIFGIDYLKKKDKKYEFQCK